MHHQKNKINFYIAWMIVTMSKAFALHIIDLGSVLDILRSSVSLLGNSCAQSL